MAYFIYLVNDPVLGPTHGQKASKDSKLVFKSMGYAPGDDGAPFELRFGADFEGKFIKSQSTPVKGPGGQDKTTFVSAKNGKHEEVEITLQKNAAHPPHGYKYDVVMGSKCWDPRVVPR